MEKQNAKLHVGDCKCRYNGKCKFRIAGTVTSGFKFQTGWVTQTIHSGSRLQADWVGKTGPGNTHEEHTIQSKQKRKKRANSEHNTRVPGENPCRPWENIQTPHRITQIATGDFAYLIVSLSTKCSNEDTANVTNYSFTSKTHMQRFWLQ